MRNYINYFHALFKEFKDTSLGRCELPDWDSELLKTNKQYDVLFNWIPIIQTMPNCRNSLNSFLLKVENDGEAYRAKFYGPGLYLKFYLTPRG